MVPIKHYKTYTVGRTSEMLAPGGVPGGVYGCDLHLMGGERCVGMVGVLIGALSF
jgi:hypothetical protein